MDRRDTYEQQSNCSTNAAAWISLEEQQSGLLGNRIRRIRTAEGRAEASKWYCVAGEIILRVGSVFCKLKNDDDRHSVRPTEGRSQ